MKKIVLIILIVLTIVVLSACEDDSLEAQLKRAKEASSAAQEAYEQSKENYNDMLNDFADYKKSQDYLDSFK